MSGLSINSLVAQRNANISVKTENTAKQDTAVFSSFMENTTAKSKDYYNASETGRGADTRPEKTVRAVEKSSGRVADKVTKKDSAEKDNEYSIAELVAIGSIDKDCVSKEVLEQVADAVKVILMDELGISADTLQSMMNVLSLSDADLLNGDNLKALIMLNYGISDSVGLMMDEKAYQSLVNVMAEVDSAVDMYCEQAGMTAEELKAFAELNAAGGLSDGDIFMEDTLAVAEDVVALEDEDTADDIIVEVKKTSSEIKTAALQAVSGSENAENQNPMAGNQDENATMEDGGQHTVGNVQTNIQTITTESGVQTVFTRLTETLDMVKQIVEQIRVQISPDTTSMEMQLNPENLGKVMLNVSTKNGEVTAQLTVENEAVKAAVESQLVQLKESLNNQGLKVEAVEVSVETRSFERQEQESGQGRQDAEEIVEKQNTIRRRNINLREALTEDGLLKDGLTEEEVLTQKLMKAHGNMVDFMA